MCGICGVVEFEGSKGVDPELVRRMVSAINHRGPNDSGVYVNQNVGLGHARLSILDLSINGHQPMQSMDKRFWITFNGEIYNHSELYTDLRTRGYSFNSRTDTEVLVNLWAEYGVEALQKIEGMYAFAVWDSLTNDLYLARDRLGQKPLFYASSNNRFYFASEPKAILQDERFNVEPDLLSIQQYLVYQSVPAPMSAFKGMNKLGAGQYIRIDSVGSVSEHTYWQMSYKNQYTDISEEELQDIIISELKRSIKMRLMSDVPLGAFLSGGVDSSLVVALMSEMSGARIKTFSIGFDEKSHDETKYARQVAELYHTDHYEYYVTPDASKIINDLVWYYNEPFADPSAVPTYYLAQMAAKRVTVALTGDAGDENFGGYNRYYFPSGINRGSCQSSSYLRELIPWYSHVVSSRNFDSEFCEASLDYNRYLYHKRFSWWNEDGLFRLLTPEFWDRVNYNMPIDYLLRMFDSCDSDNFFDKCTFFDMKHYIADTLMTKVDIACMAWSIEARSPMLDHKFVEMACRTPAKYKTRGGREGKYILKKAASRYLPQEIVYRDKMGFGVPLASWFRNDLKELAYDTLLSSTAAARGYFDMRYVEDILDMHQRGIDQQYLIWSLLMLEEWHKMFIDRSIAPSGSNAEYWKVMNISKDSREEITYPKTSSSIDNTELALMRFVDLSKVDKGVGEYEYTYELPEEVYSELIDCGEDSSLTLYEYYAPLVGVGDRSLISGGRYCMEGKTLIFSASDNSDPRENRHCYTFTISEAVYKALCGE